MQNALQILRSLDGFCQAEGCTEEDVSRAEKAIGLHFAPDYRQYLLACGLAAFGGRELTGICSSDRLYVAAVTKEERQWNPSVSADCYVIEQLLVDGIVIWQNEAGTVFQTSPGRPPKPIADSLAAYLSE